MENQESKEPSPLDDVVKERIPLEVRVFGGSSQAVPKPPSTARLKMGVRIGSKSFASAESAQVRDDEEIHRLEVPESDPDPEEDAVKLQSPESATAQAMVPLVRRQKKKRWNQTQLTTAVVGGILLFLGIPLVVARIMREPEREDQTVRLQLEGEFDDSEVSQLFQDAAVLTGKAEEVLRHYASAKNAHEASQWVRDPERVEPKMEEFWTPWATEPALDPTTPLVPAVLDSARASFAIEGRKGDFSPFSVRFVRVGKELKLDWEASFGIGDMPVSRLPKVAGNRSLTVRALLRREHYFTATFPENAYLCYKLLDDSSETPVWGYAALNSPVAAALKTEMDEESLVVEPSKELEATLRISRVSGSGKNEFQITEMIHKGWVSP